MRLQKASRPPQTPIRRRRKPPRQNHLAEHIRIGDRVKVYWPKMFKFYQGTVAATVKEGKHRIEYDDGDVEDLVMSNELFRFIGASAERVAVSALVSMKNFKG